MRISLLLLFQLLKIETISSEKHCVISMNTLSCAYNLSEDSSLSIQNTDIRSLDLSGAMINDTIESLVRGYGNLEELNLSSCGIRQLYNSTFSGIPKLVKLDLSDNMIEHIDRYTFRNMISLKILILSKNLLKSLDHFELDELPELNVLDISGNQLEYLPDGIMHKLLNDPKFSLITTNNPWNCENVKWKKFLQMHEALEDWFCTSGGTSHLTTFKNKKLECKGDSYVIREKCGIVRCSWWIVGAVWIGVILGNVNKLNRLLYQSKCRKKKARIERAIGTENDIHHLMKQERFVAHIEETELKTKT